MFIKKFLLNSDNVLADSYLWNFISSIFFGFQSVFLLIVLTRTVNLEDSGIFTIAYANASLFLFIGKYGVRNYQVSDIKEQHTFGDYKAARLISVFAMCFISFIYVVFSFSFNDYSVYKSVIVLLMCLYKLPDAIEDVYFGEYQRQGRLDVAAKAMSLRLFVSIVTLAIAIIVFRDLVLSLIISVVLSFVVLIVLIRITVQEFKINITRGKGSVHRIFVECFPLFAGTFLSQYINNASKYAIDAQLSDELQACYGFISMPVFVIGLLNNVIFSPVIHKMAKYWDSGDYNKFLKRFLIQVTIVVGLTCVLIFGAWLIGIPILSFLYNTDLSPYKTELLVLLLGGGFLALSGLLNTMITIMRFQKVLLIGYIIVSVFAFFYANNVVINYGVLGAAWLYTFLMVMLCVIFVIVFSIGLFRNKYCQINNKN